MGTCRPLSDRSPSSSPGNAGMPGRIGAGRGGKRGFRGLLPAQKLDHMHRFRALSPRSHAVCHELSQFGRQVDSRHLRSCDQKSAPIWADIVCWFTEYSGVLGSTGPLGWTEMRTPARSYGSVAPNAAFHHSAVRRQCKPCCNAAAHHCATPDT